MTLPTACWLEEKEERRKREWNKWRDCRAKYEHEFVRQTKKEWLQSKRTTWWVLHKAPPSESIRWDHATLLTLVQREPRRAASPVYPEGGHEMGVQLQM